MIPGLDRRIFWDILGTIQFENQLVENDDSEKQIRTGEIAANCENISVRILTMTAGLLPIIRLPMGSRAGDDSCDHCCL
jgi:hypothetical protein